MASLYLREDCDELENPAMASVVAELVHLVGESRGSMKRLDSGTMELRLETGEVFHLGKETITRVA